MNRISAQLDGVPRVIEPDLVLGSAAAIQSAFVETCKCSSPPPHSALFAVVTMERDFNKWLPRILPNKDVHHICAVEKVNRTLNVWEVPFSPNRLFRLLIYNQYPLA